MGHISRDISDRLGISHRTPISADAVVSIRARLIGSPGLAMELLARQFHAAGLEVVGHDAHAEEADVAVLVVPEADHWDEARAAALPIVLVLGEKADDGEVVEWVLAGADAVLHCDDDAGTVLDVLEEVTRGGSVLGPTQVRAVAGMARAAAARPGVVLSRRETEILRSIAEGNSVKQTARELAVSPKTVENLQGRLFRKLSARNRAQAVARAHSMGLL